MRRPRKGHVLRDGAVGGRGTGDGGQADPRGTGTAQRRCEGVVWGGGGGGKGPGEGGGRRTGPALLRGPGGGGRVL